MKIPKFKLALLIGIILGTILYGTLLHSFLYKPQKEWNDEAKEVVCNITHVWRDHYERISFGNTFFIYVNETKSLIIEYPYYDGVLEIAYNRTCVYNPSYDNIKLDYINLTTTTYVTWIGIALGCLSTIIFVCVEIIRRRNITPTKYSSLLSK